MANTTDALELKVLERLSALGGRCDSIDNLFSDLTCRVTHREKICRQLQEAGQLSFREDIVRFGLTLTGKTLLKLDTSVWPVTPDELLVLRSCLKGRIGPQHIHPRVPVNQRQNLIRQLIHKQLLVAYQTTIFEIELTTQYFASDETRQLPDRPEPVVWTDDQFTPNVSDSEF
jgi:hypothetical protein